ncbi:Wiskott-Aldrich syndrome protein family member [Sergentomyia squamirostris]
MPFVQRVVSPVYIARSTKASGRPQSPPKVNGGPSNYVPEAGCSTAGVSLVPNKCSDDGDQNATTSSKVVPVNDYELETVTNVTLSNALKQLASLVLVANDIFTELNKELQGISERSRGIKQRIDGLQQRVDEFDPKMVAVRKS